MFTICPVGFNRNLVDKYNVLLRDIRELGSELNAMLASNLPAVFLIAKVLSARASFHPLNTSVFSCNCLGFFMRGKELSNIRRVALIT